jgi:hypothetical protein
MSVQTPIGERKLTVAPKLASNVLTGKVAGDDGNTTDVVDGTANGDNVHIQGLNY